MPENHILTLTAARTSNLTCIISLDVEYCCPNFGIAFLNLLGIKIKLLESIHQ
jgi:hypothetical protein